MARRLAHFSDPRLDAQIGELIKKHKELKKDIEQLERRLKQSMGVTVDLGDELQQHKRLFLPHGVDGAGFHNSIYRGKYLGNQVTPEQYARIADGTFEDMYIGDYWTINGTTYLIAAFNYYRNSGDSTLTTNHVTLVTAGSMYSHRMNPTDTTDGGYVGSEMYSSGLDQAKTKIYADFAGRVVKHRKYLSNAISDGQASAGVWVDSDVELMNEVMVYGSVVSGKGGLYNIGTEKSQLPLFALRPDRLTLSVAWWLRDVCSAQTFACVYYTGLPRTFHASYALGVRPVFSIA